MINLLSLCYSTEAELDWTGLPPQQNRSRTAAVTTGRLEYSLNPVNDVTMFPISDQKSPVNESCSQRTSETGWTQPSNWQQNRSVSVLLSRVHTSTNTPQALFSPYRLYSEPPDPDILLGSVIIIIICIICIIIIIIAFMLSGHTFCLKNSSATWETNMFYLPLFWRSDFLFTWQQFFFVFVRHVMKMILVLSRRRCDITAELQVRSGPFLS